MHLLGSLIKKGIELKAQFDDRPEEALQHQKDQLTSLLEKAKDTAFGKYYDFAGILKASDPEVAYRERLPVFEYGAIHQRWWEQGEDFPDITWPGKNSYFAKSSGTTGSKPKRIPVTDAMLDSIRKVSIAQLTSINNFDLPEDFFEREMMALSSHTSLEQYKGRQEGEISAITASNVPAWFEGFFRPGPEISNITDWDERVKAIAKAAPQWDVGALSGIPSWVLLMLKEVIKEHRLDSIHDIWPGLRVYTPGGVAFGPYKEKFEALFSKPVHVMDTYLASEGFFAYNARPDTKAMRLALNHGIYFEFVPFDKRGFDDQANLLDEPEVHSIADVEADTDYALLVSTPAGNYRYMIGDTVRFTDLARKEIIITGRTKHFLNVVGSQLSEAKMDQAVEALSEQQGLSIEEFCLAAVQNEEEEYQHRWILASEDLDSVKEREDLAQCLDQYLKENNKNYKVARGKALKGVRVTAIPLQKFYDYQEKNRKKGGQTKTKKLLSEEDFRDFLDFLQSN